MKLKHGIAAAAAALAVLALPVSSASASSSRDDGMTELHYCDGWVGHAGSCATAIVPDDEWAQAARAIDACLPPFPASWTADEVEACILGSGYRAGPRTEIDANGVIHPAGSDRLKHKHKRKRHHKRGHRHHGPIARASIG
jgi:hypothetical protein